MAVVEQGSIERTIQEWWGTLPALTGVVPAAKVITGAAQDDSIGAEYVILTAEVEPRFHTNSGSGETGDLDVSCYFNSYADGRAFSDIIRQSLDRQTRSDQYLNVTKCRYTALVYEQLEDGRWQFTTTFSVDYQRQ